MRDELDDRAGAQYGLLLGIPVTLMMTVGRPGFKAGVLTLLALHMLLGAVTLWRRTALPYSTAADVLGCLTFLWMARNTLIAGEIVPPTVPSLAGALCTILLGTGMLWLESRVHPEAWAAWRDFMRDKSGWDIAMLRHIPNLRSR